MPSRCLLFGFSLSHVLMFLLHISTQQPYIELWDAIYFVKFQSWRIFSSQWNCETAHSHTRSKDWNLKLLSSLDIVALLKLSFVFCFHSLIYFVSFFSSWIYHSHSLHSCRIVKRSVHPILSVRACEKERERTREYLLWILRAETNRHMKYDYDVFSRHQWADENYSQSFHIIK